MGGAFLIAYGLTPEAALIALQRQEEQACAQGLIDVRARPEVEWEDDSWVATMWVHS